MNYTGEILEVQKKQGRLEDAGDFPKVVLIDMVSYCNLKCSMWVHKNWSGKQLWMRTIPIVTKSGKRELH